MHEKHLEIINLRKQFGSAVAVEELNLAVPKGSFTCLLGPSGCGKTTTLRMIAGFVEPDAGDVLIGGVSQGGRLANRRPTSIVFQDYALFPHMTVRDNVGYGLRSQRRSKAELVDRVEKALTLMGLEHLSDRYPRELSGGQQQRVALGRSVAVEPEVLLMDEPLSNLDAKLRARLRTDLKDLQQRLGITTVYVTHDQEEALAMSDMVAVMSEGRLEQYGTPDEIYSNPSTAFVAEFMGMNFLPCVVETVADESISVRLETEQPVEIPISRAAGGPVVTGEAVALVLRSETMQLVREPAAEQFLVAASHIGSQFVGPVRRNWIDVSGAELVVDEYDPSSSDPATPGDKVWLAMDLTQSTLMKGGADMVLRAEELIA